MLRMLREKGKEKKWLERSTQKIDEKSSKGLCFVFCTVRRS
jgi:hypothetical protein